MGKKSSKSSATIGAALAAVAVVDATSGVAEAAIVDQLLESMGDGEIVEHSGDSPEDSASIELADEHVADLSQALQIDEAKAAIYAEQGSADPIDALFGGETPPATSEDAVATGKKGKGKGKGKKAEATPKEPKPAATPRATSVTHKPGDLLLAKLKGDIGFLVFSMSDAELAPDALQAKCDAFIAEMNITMGDKAIADKVSEKVIQLLVGLKNGSPMNEIMKRAFMVLKKDGFLTSGDKGNLQANLLTKPYSQGTARSQSNQIFSLFPLLGITTKSEKGRMVANPDSTILSLANAQLGL